VTEVAFAAPCGGRFGNPGRCVSVDHDLRLNSIYLSHVAPSHYPECEGAWHANLLVVKLHVTPYKPRRGGSRTILPRFGYEGT
jgi:hypothetical protein